MDSFTKNMVVDSSWSFSDLTKKETSYASHGYHKYPAKFIPQLVKRLILEYSREGDLVLDPFGGCGTTLVEAKLNNRNSISIDVNDAAILIASAKAEAIDPAILETNNKLILERIAKSNDHKDYYANANSRLKYWFKRKQFNKLFKIYNEIQRESDKNIKTFYNCCFSDILKNCSKWYSKSIKPQRDSSKKDVEPAHAFIEHLNYMTKQNLEYYNLLDKSINIVESSVKKADARKTMLPKNSVDLIITSPPYAISYEYADIHQLSLLWFGSTKNIAGIRKDYIGTASKRKAIKSARIRSTRGLNTIKSLERLDTGLANQIANYIVDLDLTFREMHRVLKHGKKMCIILGDTRYLGIKIPNTDMAIELINNAGFNINKVIKRKICSKIFTPYRDSTGKFSDGESGKKRRIYQYEYIIIAKKKLLLMDCGVRFFTYIYNKFLISLQEAGNLALWDKYDN